MAHGGSGGHGRRHSGGTWIVFAVIIVVSALLGAIDEMDLEIPDIDVPAIDASSVVLPFTQFMEDSLMIVLLAILIVLFFVFCVRVVRQQNVGVIESFGRFSRIANPGLTVLIPLVETMRAVSLMTQDLHFEFDAKTKDNVTIGMDVAVQYHVDMAPTNNVRESGIYRSVYTLVSPEAQIKDYFADALRSQIPTRDLETVFSEKDAIASAIGEDVREKMIGYGYQIVTTLITSIKLPKDVQTSMNRIITTANDRISATNEAEAAKAKAVIAAQAEAESMKSQGEGIANQRIAIAEGLAQSLATIQDSGLSSEEANMLLMFTQRIGMMEKFAEGGSSTLVIPEDMGSTDILTQMMAAEKANNQK